MSGINKVILIGHLGKDPEVRYLEAGTAVVRFTLATTETFIRKDGSKVEQTEWHHIVLWRGLANTAAKYLQKGKQIYLEGKIRTRFFEDNRGEKKTITEIIGEHFTMLGRKDDIARDINQLNAQSKEDAPMCYEDSPDDDLPF